jgi:hypothetical protein
MIGSAIVVFVPARDEFLISRNSCRMGYWLYSALISRVTHAFLKRKTLLHPLNLPAIHPSKTHQLPNSPLNIRRHCIEKIMAQNTKQRFAQVQPIYTPSVTAYSNAAATHANSMHSPRYPPTPSLQHPCIQSANSVKYPLVSQRTILHDVPC